jgi:3',5'-nucleoside bisphosphate phosphatase
MPGYEPFLLCDFHVHTQWSDGKLSVAEVVDLYGSTGKFDVIAITDHILMKKDLLARAGRIATLGRRAFGVREHDFEHYLENVRAEAARALEQYGMLVIPGAEITQNRLAGRKNSHIIALDIQRYISADQSADEIAANRDDLFSVTSLKHYPYVANSDFHKPKHLYSWKTLVRSEKNWPAVRRALRDNVDIALTLFRNGSRGRAF